MMHTGLGSGKVKWWAGKRSGCSKWPGNGENSALFLKGRVGSQEEPGRFGAMELLHPEGEEKNDVRAGTNTGSGDREAQR